MSVLLMRPDGNGFYAEPGSEEWDRLMQSGFTLTREAYDAMNVIDHQAALDQAKANQAAANQAVKDAQKALAEHQAAEVAYADAEAKAQAEALAAAQAPVDPIVDTQTEETPPAEGS